MKITDVRNFAVSLPEVTEEPHFDFSSFRVKGKIFVTVPPDEAHIHVFVDEEKRDLVVAADPGSFEMLWWGKKVVGVRVTLAAANSEVIKDMILSAWKRKAPKRLVQTFEAS